MSISTTSSLVLASPAIPPLTSDLQIPTNIERAGRRAKAAGAEEEKFAALLAKKMPVTPPDDCAADIIQGLRKGRKRIITGHMSSTMFWLSRLLPNMYPKLRQMLT